jgi:hypothetical protein
MARVGGRRGYGGGRAAHLWQLLLLLLRVLSGGQVAVVGTAAGPVGHVAEIEREEC